MITGNGRTGKGKGMTEGEERTTRDLIGTVENEIGIDKVMAKDSIVTHAHIIGIDNTKAGEMKRVIKGMNGTIEDEIRIDKVMAKGSVVKIGDKTGIENVRKVEVRKAIEDMIGIPEIVTQEDRIGKEEVLEIEMILNEKEEVEMTGGTKDQRDRMMLGQQRGEEVLEGLGTRNVKKLKRTGTIKLLRERLTLQMKREGRINKEQIDNVAIVLKRKNRSDLNNVMTKKDREEKRGHRENIAKKPRVKIEEEKRFVEIYFPIQTKSN